LWRPELIWLNVISDAIIALSYFSIPFALALFVSKRSDVEFGWVFWAFAIFITACGMTHVMSIWTLWVPDYGIEGLVKAATAAASIITAIMLWPLLPKALALPSPSQLRRAQQELETQIVHRLEAEERLRQSQKLEAVGQLTGGVAHDFNNLLTVIIGNLEIAQQNLSSWSREAEEYVRRAIANAMGGAQRATALTQRLLAFARRQPLAPKPINVNGLVQGLSEFIRRTLGEEVDLEVVGSAGLWQVEADQGELEAAILNLVVNARDAMPEGGKLSIETSNAFLDEAYCRDQMDIKAGQ
jgi:signal transduction histidine kinase